MAKIGFYVKTASLLLTLAVSLLVGCGGGSYTSSDSDAGVTNDVTTGGQSSVISSQSSVRSTGGQTVVSSQSSVVSQSTGGQTGSQTTVVSQSTGGTSAIGSQTSLTGGTSSTAGTTRYWTSFINDNEVYIPYDYQNSYLSIGSCAGDTLGTQVSAILCSCTSGSNNEYTGSLDGNCSRNSAAQCAALSVGDTTHYHIFTWECPTVLSPKDSTTGGSSALVATGGSSAVAATGGSAAVTATGGSSAVAPTTYSVTYLNQVASQSVQAPGTCPSGQSVTACTCVISGMQSTLTSCNPSACAIENSKQYPQSVFTWSCT